MKQITYSQHVGADSEWVLNACDLAEQNLIVGKNATGKTKTLNVIYNTASYISGRTELNLHPQDYTYVFTLNDHETLTYHAAYAQDAILFETLKKNDQTLLERDENGSGKIWAHELQDAIGFKIQHNELAIKAKRDALQHPFLESIHNWANRVRIFRFGSDVGKTNIAILQKGSAAVRSNDFESIQPVRLFKTGQKLLGPDFIKLVIQDLNAMDFPVEGIEIGEPISIKLEGNIPGQPTILRIKEEGIKSWIDQFDLSQGMYRSIILLMYIRVAMADGEPNLILLDDVGEGLDFGRSAKLINTVLSNTKVDDIQLIMTTNDRFIMNAVDLKLWKIISRTGPSLNFRNYGNSKADFDRFLTLGLNNFDFFTGNFYN